MFEAETTGTAVSNAPVSPSPATVISDQDAEGRVLVEIDGATTGAWSARVAVPFPVRSGDSVLVIGARPHDLYVVGVLKRDGGEPSESLATKAGAMVDVEDDRTVRVFSKRGEVVLEYDSISERTRILVPHGDVEFAAKEGNMSFVAGRSIRFAATSVEVTARQRVRLAVLGAAKRLTSALTLLAGTSRLDSAKLHVRSGRAKLDLEETEYRGRAVRAALSEARLVLDRMETVAETAIHRASSVYRTVRDLTLLRTRRQRTIVDDSYDVSAGRARMRSKEAFKIDGEKIYLG